MLPGFFDSGKMTYERADDKMGKNDGKEDSEVEVLKLWRVVARNDRFTKGEKQNEKL